MFRTGFALPALGLGSFILRKWIFPCYGIFKARRIRTARFCSCCRSCFKQKISYCCRSYNYTSQHFFRERLNRPKYNLSFNLKNEWVNINSNSRKKYILINCQQSKALKFDPSSTVKIEQNKPDNHRRYPIWNPL